MPLYLPYCCYYSLPKKKHRLPVHATNKGAGTLEGGLPYLYVILSYAYAWRVLSATTHTRAGPNLVLEAHGDEIEELVHAGPVQAHDGRVSQLLPPRANPETRPQSAETGKESI